MKIQIKEETLNNYIAWIVIIGLFLITDILFSITIPFSNSPSLNLLGLPLMLLLSALLIGSGLAFNHVRKWFITFEVLPQKPDQRTTSLKLLLSEKEVAYYNKKYEQYVTEYKVNQSDADYLSFNDYIIERIDCGIIETEGPENI